MYLKSLTLKGFKSFASSTTMQLEPGITCIVGPNGSGKSNVVDALAWVMGEQGAKSLRGGKMEDVIFAGTAGRPPLGRAEVALTIDNTDGALPIDYTEVTITRTMFRGGGSEYAINGRACRLLDIQELLSDAGRWINGQRIEVSGGALSRQAAAATPAPSPQGTPPAAGEAMAAVEDWPAMVERTEALARFKDGRLRVLVATDIAARGIDVDGVTHVVQYDLPDVPESYVHRIGRTARAGASGEAVAPTPWRPAPRCAALERCGFRREAHQTPLEFAFAVNMPEAVKITEQYNNVRFGERNLSETEAREIEGDEPGSLRETSSSSSSKASAWSSLAASARMRARRSRRKTRSASSCTSV